jgi:hypothetical protein
MKFLRAGQTKLVSTITAFLCSCTQEDGRSLTSGVPESIKLDSREPRLKWEHVRNCLCSPEGQQYPAAGSHM